jgi:hypothetical protein
MDVINGYFRTLRLLLPRGQRDDIVRELSEEIRSQVAEREASLGRSLTANEQAVIIGQYGHPLVTAAQYRPQRHLIGPVVFPYYWIVLKVTLTLVALGHLVGALMLLAGGAPLEQMGQVVENAVATALKVTAWLTALGAFADYWLSRPGALQTPGGIVAFPAQQAWRAVEKAQATLPGLHDQRSRRWPGAARGTQTSVSRLVISLVVSVWWLAGLRIPYLFFGPGAEGLEWGDAMNQMYPVLVVAQVTMLVEQFVRHGRAGQPGIFRVTRFVWLVAGWALIYLVASSDHQWMVWSSEAAVRSNATVVMRFAGRDISLVDFVNYVWSILFILVAIASIGGSLKTLVGRIRGTPDTAHAA